MALFAIIQNDKVANIIIADTKEIAELVTGNLAVEFQPTDYVIIGLEYKNGSFIVPPPPPIDPNPPLPLALQKPE
jgi:hypothetical protein